MEEEEEKEEEAEAEEQEEQAEQEEQEKAKNTTKAPAAKRQAGLNGARTDVPKTISAYQRALEYPRTFTLPRSALRHYLVLRTT